MAYQVIARKYRPQRFSDVVGQEHVTQTLSNAIRQQRIAHAFLFVGPRGTGKTTIARIFAKCLNCTGGPLVDFADDDPRCIEISEGRALDVLEIDGASNRGIEEIRELRDTVKYAPATSKFKIYIIDEVHMLTKEAFNALLKTLEEPPAHVKFMFATTEPEKVLTTILSRCQRFDLKRIPITLIAKHLGYISRNEKIEVEEAALQAIARGADGCMRDAESTLDQLISFCGDKIVENDVLSMFGLSSRLQIQNLAQAILDKDMALALQELHALANNGKDLSRLVSDLLGHFRNLMLWKVTKGNSAVLELSEFETQVLVRQEALIQLEALARILEVLVFCESRLRDTLSKGILIEVSLLEAIQARDSISIDSVLKQLQQFRAEGVSSVQPTAPVARPAAAAPVKRIEPVPAPAAAPAPAPVIAPKPAEPVAPVVSAPAKPAMTPPAPAVPAPVIEKPTVTAPAAPAAPALILSATEPTAPAATPIKGDLSDIWAALLKIVGVQSRFVLSYLGRATPISFDNNILSLEFPADAETEMNMVDNSKNRELIQAALREMGFSETKLKYRMQSASEASSQPAPVAAAPAARPTLASRATPAAKPASAILPKEAPAPEPPAQPLLTQEELKNDPLIQKALELFKAQLVDMH